MKKIFILSGALMMSALTFTSCNNDDDNKNDDVEFSVTETTPVVDEDNYSLNTTAANYSVKLFGESAVDGCADVVSELEAANAIIGSAKLPLRKPGNGWSKSRLRTRRHRLRSMRLVRILRLPVCIGNRARLSLVELLLISTSTQLSTRGLSTVRCCSAISITV